MEPNNAAPNRRILVIDDNPSIHGDFRKILCPDEPKRSTLKLTETVLFGPLPDDENPLLFEVDSAEQGQAGVEKIKQSLAKGTPYALAFVDMRMPPGWDGAKTAQEIRRIDSEIQIVICTAYSDHSWQEMFEIVGHDEPLNVLKKPFDPEDALRLANKLTEKWTALYSSSIKNPASGA